MQTNDAKKTDDTKKTDNDTILSPNEIAKKLTPEDFAAFANSMNDFFAKQGKDAGKELSGPLSNHTAEVDSNDNILLIPLSSKGGDVQINNTQTTHNDDEKDSKKLVQDINAMKLNDKMPPEEVYCLAGKLDELNLAAENKGGDVKKEVKEFSHLVDKHFLLPSQQANQSKNAQVTNDDKNDNNLPEIIR
jgi:hypothetical protein